MDFLRGAQTRSTSNYIMINICDSRLSPALLRGGQTPTVGHILCPTGHAKSHRMWLIVKSRTCTHTHTQRVQPVGMWLSTDVFRTSSDCSFPRIPSVGERAHSASNMVRNIGESFPATVLLIRRVRPQSERRQASGHLQIRERMPRRRYCLRSGRLVHDGAAKRVEMPGPRRCSKISRESEGTPREQPSSARVCWRASSVCEWRDAWARLIPLVLSIANVAGSSSSSREG